MFFQNRTGMIEEIEKDQTKTKLFNRGETQNSQTKLNTSSTNAAYNHAITQDNYSICELSKYSNDHQQSDKSTATSSQSTCLTVTMKHFSTVRLVPLDHCITWFICPINSESLVVLAVLHCIQRAARASGLRILDVLVVVGSVASNPIDRPLALIDAGGRCSHVPPRRGHSAAARSIQMERAIGDASSDPSGSKIGLGDNDHARRLPTTNNLIMTNIYIYIYIYIHADHWQSK